MWFSTSRKPSPRTRRLARTLAGFFGLDHSAEGEAGRMIRVSGRKIEFLYGNELVLRPSRNI